MDSNYYQTTTFLCCNSSEEYNDTNNTNNSTHKASMFNIYIFPVFVIITIVGLIGNLFVIVTVVTNRQMRSTTNILIFNLALADLLFVVICVPTTGTSYVVEWPFGLVVCRVTQYVVHVTAYASINTLVLMSLDRYLAVVHPIQSMTIRTTKNACIAVVLMWLIICSSNTLFFMDFSLVDIDGNIMCINERMVDESSAPHSMDPITYAKVFYGLFFLFGLFLPLLFVITLYALMVNRLMKLGKSLITAKTKRTTGSDNTTNSSISNIKNNIFLNHNNISLAQNKTGILNKKINENNPNESTPQNQILQHTNLSNVDSTLCDNISQAVVNNHSTKQPSQIKRTSDNMMAKRRVTKMVVIVITIFAICWIPLHIIFLLQSFTNIEVENISIRIFSNCLAYTNSCVNPILYAFLSENFRNSFKRLCFACFSRSKNNRMVGGRYYGGNKTSVRTGNNLVIERTTIVNDTMALEMPKNIPEKEEMIRAANKRRFKFLIRRARGLEAMRLKKLNENSSKNGEQIDVDNDGE